ncbi:MAG: cation transporter [Chloroflexi bacterium]|nr:cation transporter [Chloroflexota bacterium]
MSAAESSRDVRALKLAVGLYAVIFIAKLVTFQVTGVMSLFAEAFHTLSDIFIAGFLLVAALYSARRADERYMFGYGRAQNVGALVAAILFISFTAYKLYEEAIPRLFASEAATYENLWVALAVLVANLAIIGWPFVGLLRRRDRGAAAKAQLMAYLNDVLGISAAIVGTLFVMAGVAIADPIASLVVATIIAIDGIVLFRENVGFLLGRSPGNEYLSHLEDLARSVPGVVDVHEIRAEYVGPDVVHAGLHVAVAPGIQIEEADRIGSEVRRRIHDSSESDTCVVQVEPAAPALAATA